MTIAPTLDQPTGSVALPLLQSGLLARVPGVVHGFTRRISGLGLADGNASYSGGRNRDDAWNTRQLWCQAHGLDAETIVTAGQIHGADVLRVRRDNAGTGARPASGMLGRGDAMIANEAGVILWSHHADCLPLLLVDPGDDGRGPAVGVAHAGWRGTVSDVAGAAVRTMTDQFGSRPEDLLAYIGPAIGSCCYEVGPEVIVAWREQAADAANRAVASFGAGVAFDLPAANRLLLERAGLDPARIEHSGICTRCRANEWFSHRAQGAATGRFAAFIALAG